MVLNSKNCFKTLVGNKISGGTFGVIGLTIICVLSLFLLNFSKENKIIKREQILYQALLKESFIVSLESQVYHDRDLWSNLNLYNVTDGKRAQFKSFLGNKSLVLFIHSNMCNSCVEKEIENFLTLLADDRLKLDNALVILGGFKRDVIENSSNFKSIINSAYYIPKNELHFNFERLSKPCMVLFKFGYPEFVYLSSGSQEEYFKVWKSFMLKSKG